MSDSTPRGTRGLTLGKYAPLHRGHQLVIETALAEMDEVIAIIYDCPEVIDVPLAVRAAWLRRLYPRLVVIEARGGPTEVGEEPRIQRMHEEYILGTLGIAGITHFYSSETYGGHMSRALGAVDLRVDSDRRAVPVSGTAIRKDPFQARLWVDRIVYRDLIRKVVFLGAPSTGKTTLASALAARYGTVWMPEFGREYWERHQVDRRLRPEELVHIAEEHREREEALAHEARSVLFADTNALTTLSFALHYHGRAAPRLLRLAEEEEGRWNLVFLCGTDIPYEDTWDRSGEVERERFQDAVRADLSARGIPFTELRGNLVTRMAEVAGRGRAGLFPRDRDLRLVGMGEGTE